MQEIGIDIIGDLYLTPDDRFDWEGKATSLYCILVGNISSDIDVIVRTITHLSTLYHGVFYVPGTLEYQYINYQPERMYELIDVVEQIPNTCLLHQNVAIIDGIGILGVNGWGDAGINDSVDDLIRILAREEDINYLKNGLTKLQRHLDIKKIILVTNSVPLRTLYYKEDPAHVKYQTDLTVVLANDTEKKVTHWVFGTYDKLVDTVIDNVTYVNNPKPSNGIYWAKRLNIQVGV